MQRFSDELPIISQNLSPFYYRIICFQPPGFLEERHRLIGVQFQSNKCLPFQIECVMNFLKLEPQFDFPIYQLN